MDLMFVSHTFIVRESKKGLIFIIFFDNVQSVDLIPPTC